ncbi:DUF4049 domain-containing protein [Escherichia coli]|nr:DUF4049 domain-containing protein [Escherichia coli]
MIKNTKTWLHLHTYIKNNKLLYNLLNTRDMILNELHQHVFF